MAEVLRIKRHLDVDPADAIILSGKRMRLSTEVQSEEDVSFSKILTFVGTVKTQDDSVVRLLSKALKTNETSSPTSEDQTRRPINILKSKLRDKAKSWSKENRFKLVNTQRGLKHASETALDEESKQMFKLYDVVTDCQGTPSQNTIEEKPVQEITCNGVAMIREQASGDARDSDQEYVYDLYFMKGKELDSGITDQTLSIEPCNLEDALYRENEGSDDSPYDEEDEDSNDENHWRNDYPEENSDFEKELDYFGGYDEKLVEQVVACGIHDDDDDREEVDDNEELITSTSFDSEVHRNGLAYAKFKESILRSSNREYDDDGDEEDN